MNTRTHPDWDLEPVLDWIFEEGRFCSDLNDLVSQLGARLDATGAPVWRLRMGMRTLHPLIAASSSIWQRGGDDAVHLDASHGMEGRASYIGSPLEYIARTGNTFRKRLDADLSGEDHVILHELKQQGATDYLGVPVRYQGGSGAILTFATDTRRGFDGGDITRFERLALVLAPVLEVFRLRQLSEAVATTYLGSRSGRKVLGGQITRGNIETVNAAILFSDIRGWTQLNAQVPPEEVVARANRYFEIISSAVEGHDGEILKFLGDGVLAIFPAEDDRETACSNALAATRDALDHAQAADPPLELSFGIGMHVGKVMYGNVGSRTRLDFTVLGQAVNIAARIEALCRPLGRPVLYSRDFADQLAEPSDVVSDETLKGLKGKSRIFTPSGLSH